VTTTDNRLDTIATLLLSVAALATSWAGYQATLWSGEQTRHAASAAVARARASRATVRAGQLVMLDVGLFNYWLEEQARGDPRLTKFIENRFRPEFKAAFDEWNKGNPLESPESAPSPFSLRDYHVSAADTAERYDILADSEAMVAARANRSSDEYVLNAVILATVMFFAGAAQNDLRSSLRWILVGFASTACLTGIVRLFTLPRA
jgi:hypothetical protein